MSAIRLSIVVIGRNEAERLGACLDSVLRETSSLDQTEIIFVDSGSTDDSVAIAAERGIETVEIGPANAARARNAGLQRAGGDLVHFLDGDMILAPSWLQTGMQSMAAEGCDAIAGRVIEEMKEATIYSRVFGLDWNDQTGEVETLGGASLWRRHVLEDLGGFDEGLDVGEDPDLSLRARARGYRLVQLSRPMVHHALGLSTALDWMKRGCSVGRSTALVFKRHGTAAGPRRRIRKAMQAHLAALLLLSLACLHLPALAFVVFGGAILLAAGKLRRPDHHRQGPAHFIHVHLIKIPFMIGALPVLLGQHEETRP